MTAIWANSVRGGLAGWLMERLRGGRRPTPRLVLLERITLAPRQSLALVEAEGRRLLVATSTEGGPVFYALDEPKAAVEPGRPNGLVGRMAASAARVSW